MAPETHIGKARRFCAEKMRGRGQVRRLGTNDLGFTRHERPQPVHRVAVHNGERIGTPRERLGQGELLRCNNVVVRLDCAPMLLVKKYPNRRLYDTRHSRYITLDDLEKTIRGGEDVTIQDAQDGRDLTQETLTQIILDRGGGRLLPASLLMRLIRLDDAALGEFLTRYVSWALDLYLQAKDRARALLPLNPLATAPFAATDALARLVLGAAQWGRGNPVDTTQAPPPAVPAPAPVEEQPPPIDLVDAMPVPEPPAPATSAVNVADEMARLRREIEALKESVGAGARPRARTTPKKRAAKRPAKRT